MNEISPEEAARIAEGDIDAPGPFDADASFDPEPSTMSTLLDAALSTEPSKPLEVIESPWSPERGAEKRVQRGIQKATNTDGIPAALDIGLGLLEMFVSRAQQEAER